MKLEADYLFTPEQAGEDEWLRRYDDKLREFLMQPDEDGYTKMVYCGEEDIVANMDNYLAERRRAKSRLKKPQRNRVGAHSSAQQHCSAARPKDAPVIFRKNLVGRRYDTTQKRQAHNPAVHMP